MTAAECRTALLVDGAKATTMADHLLYGILVELIELREDLKRRARAPASQGPPGDGGTAASRIRHPFRARFGQWATNQ